MAVKSNITIDFTGCPACEDSYRSLVALLFNTTGNIDKTLERFSLKPRRQLGNITVLLPCGAACTFLWQRGLAIINGWTC